MKYALVLALLLVAACAPQTTQPTDTLPQVEETPEQPSAPEQTVKDTNAYPTIFEGLPTDVQDILHNGEGRLEKGYSYVYEAYDGKNNLLAGRFNNAKVYQKGDQVKLELAELTSTNPDSYYDAVYLNTAEETAQGYCMNAKRCSEVGAERTVLYDNFVFMKPNDWLDSMTGATKIEERTIQNRKAIRLDGTVNGDPATIWVDRYSGLPIEASMGGNTYKYTQLALGVTDAQIAP